MRKAVNKAVLAFDILRRDFETKYGVSIPSWSRRLFVIAVFLSVQNKAIQLGVCPDMVEEILFSGLVITTEEDRIKIDGYSADRDEEVYKSYLQFFLYLEADFFPEDEKDRFVCTILLYPFLAVLNKIKPLEYREIYMRYLEVGKWEDCVGGKIKWKKEICENDMINFLNEYNDSRNLSGRKENFELLDKGYTLRKVWIAEGMEPRRC